MKIIVIFCILMMNSIYIHAMKQSHGTISAEHMLSPFCLLPADIIIYIETFCGPETRTQWPFVNRFLYTCATLIKKNGDIPLNKKDRLFYLFFGSLYNLPNLIHNTLNYFNHAYSHDCVLLQEARFHLKDLAHHDILQLIPKQNCLIIPHKSLLSWIVVAVNDQLRTIKNKLISFSREPITEIACLALVKLLLKHPRINIPDNDGKTALYYAIESIKNSQEYRNKKHIEILKVLINHQEKTVSPTCSSSCSMDLLYQDWFRYSTFEITKILLTYNLVPNINNYDTHKNTKLHNNANNNTTKLLLTQPTIDVNMRNIFEETPLHKAVNYEWIEKTKLLLADPRTDINAQNGNGNTPLHLAVQSGSIEIVKLLLADKRIENIPNEEYDTPLIYSLRQLQSLLIEFDNSSLTRDREDLKKTIAIQHQINSLLLKHFLAQ